MCTLLIPRKQAAASVAGGISAVATELQAKTAEDAKDIYENVAKEVAAAITNEDEQSFMDKIADAVKVVTKEVVEGVQDAGEAIKDHPEMIAE